MILRLESDRVAAFLRIGRTEKVQMSNDDDKWISNLFDCDDSFRNEEVTRQRYEVKRRRQWLARAPRIFDSLKFLLRELVESFDTEIQRRGRSTASCISVSNAACVVTYQYGDAFLQVMLDKEAETIECKYREGNVKRFDIHADNGTTIRPAPGTKLNGTLAETILEPFFKDVLKCLQ